MKVNILCTVIILVCRENGLFYSKQHFHSFYLDKKKQQLIKIHLAAAERSSVQLRAVTPLACSSCTREAFNLIICSTYSCYQPQTRAPMAGYSDHLAHDRRSKRAGALQRS